MDENYEIPEDEGTENREARGQGSQYETESNPRSGFDDRPQQQSQSHD